MRKKLAIIAAAVIVLAIVWAQAYSRWWSPRAKIRAMIEQTSRAILKGDVQGVLDNVAQDFLAGNLDKMGLADALRLFFAEFDQVEIILGEQRIFLSNGEAVDSMKVVVVASRGGERGYLLGQFGRPAILGVKIRRQGQWLITGVDGLPGY